MIVMYCFMYGTFVDGIDVGIYKTYCDFIIKVYIIFLM